MKKELEFENKYKRKPTCKEISNITGYDQSTIQLIEANLCDSICYDAQITMDKERKFYNEILPKITEILERLYLHNKIEPNNKVNSETFKILLNLFEMYPFNKLITEISYDRLLIGLLESGYVDGKKYTDETVANFLGKGQSQCLYFKY